MQLTMVARVLLCVRLQASLFYHSAKASFPDVELDIDVGSRPGDFHDSCEICQSQHSPAGASRGDHLVQPTIHFGPEHIDVLYAILMEVKAPYDEYDRLAALSWQQASRPDGFLMVLSYAKQWLLADCVDGVVGSAVTISDGDDSDDNDEFEDAITPPSLFLRAAMRHGLKINFVERQDGERASGCAVTWTWVLGATWGSMKQSCVEDEIRLEVQSIRMFEKTGVAGEGYSLIQDFGANTPDDGCSDDEPTASPVFRFACVVPAYQSRLVGHQPVLKVHIDKSIVIAVKDQTIVKWMGLLAPVYDWWNEWNASHPSITSAQDNAMKIAPISQISVSVERLCFLFAVHDRFCFGSTLDKFTISTSEPTHETVQSLFRSSKLRLFSSTEDLLSMQRAMALGEPLREHEILVVEHAVLSKSSHSRTQWSLDSYACKHSPSASESHVNGRHLGFTGDVHEDEIAMYNYKISLPSIRVDIDVEEMETLAWIAGKWSFFLPDPALPSVKTPSTKGAVCRSKWRMKIPSLRATLSDKRSPSSQFIAAVDNCEWNANMCSLGSYQRYSASSIVVTEGEHAFIQIIGNQRLETPAVCVDYEVFSLEDGLLPSSLRLQAPQTAEVNIFSEKIVARMYLPHVETLVKWAGMWMLSFELGFMLSTCFGYDSDGFRRNLSKLATRQNAVGHTDRGSELKVSARIAQGLELTVVHPDQTRPRSGKIDNHGEPTAVGLLETSTVLIDVRQGGKLAAGQIEVKGSVRNVQITDQTSPSVMPTSGSDMPNRRCVGSPQGMLKTDSDIAAFGGSKNSLDFGVTYTRANRGGVPREDRDKLQDHCAVRVRLESVCIAYLHRVYKQFHHYVADHIVELFLSSDLFNQRITSDGANSAYKRFVIDTSMLPVSTGEVVDMYLEATQHGRSAVQMVPSLHVEVVANDLTLALPRSSFSQDSIILHCTNARFWSSGIDPSTSEFLENGAFADEGRVSNGGLLSDANVAKAQQSRRVELRNMKRQIKNQRARILSNRSQLFIDLKNATQQAQNYLHEGFESLPAAEDAVKIIHGKILQLDQQLEELGQYLAKVDDAIEVARAEGEAFNQGGRDSFVFLSQASTSTRLRGRSASIERIRDAVSGMSQHLIAPLFVAEDAEFHDARTASDATMLSSLEKEEDMSTSSVGLFEFELVDLSGMTSNSAAPLFHHSLLTGRIDLEPESLSETSLSSYLNITLSLNELSIGASPEQYVTLLGMIYENFKELSFIVDEDTYPLCSSCGGHHYDYEYCNAIWLQIPVRIGDAALRVSAADHSIADVFCEQLELMFTMRTDDSLEFSTTALSFTAIDVRPTHSATASEIIRPIAGDGVQIQYKQKSTWTEVVYDLKVHNTNWLVIYPALEEAVRFFIDPIFSEGEFLDFDVGFMPPPPPDWSKLDFHLATHGCLFSLLEDFSKLDSRALVMLTDATATYSQSQASDGLPDMSKWHIEIDQNGVYFSQLPDLQVRLLFLISRLVSMSTCRSHSNTFAALC